MEITPNGTPSIGTRLFNLRGVVGIMGGIVLLSMAGAGWLVFNSVGAWGIPFNIGDRLDMHIQSVQEQNVENTYILSVCLNPRRQVECQQLDLRMPDSLRKKLRYNSGGP